MAETVLNCVLVAAITGGSALGAGCGLALGGVPGALLMGLAAFGLVCWWAGEVVEMWDGFARRRMD